MKLNGVRVGTTVADLPGADLAAAGFGDGAHRFRFELAEVLATESGNLQEVAVVRSGTDEQIDGIRRLRRLTSDALASASLADVAAAQFLSGQGIEIGALDTPQTVPAHVTVRYADRFPTDRLRAEYPERASQVVPVSIVDDGATLQTLQGSSVDFIIANNVLEHLEDPARSIARWFELLRPEGVLFMVVPNRRNSIDHTRPNTPLAHFQEDPAQGRRQHYLEWAEEAEGLRDEPAVTRANSLDEANYSIHFHVWDELALAGFLNQTILDHQLSFRLRLLGLQRADSETVVVLQK